MKTAKLLTVLLISIMMALPLFAQEKEAPTQILITNVSVWDGTSDGLKDVDVLVEGNKIKAAYDRNLHVEERTRMMQTWADTCDNWAGISDNVVPIHKTA